MSLATCIVCRASSGAGGCAGPCQCPQDGVDIIDHAAAGYCPLAKYGGARPDDWDRRPKALAQLTPLRITVPASVVVPREKWPFVIRVVARQKKDGDKGVGDTAKRILHRMGADGLAWLYEKATGQPCGCPDRQAKLNALYPYDQE